MGRFGDNIEVFYMGASEFNPEDTSTWMGQRARELLEAGTDPEDIGEVCEGFYWWHCFPGCLPESDAYGPNDTEAKAWRDIARDWVDSGEPIEVTLSTNDDIEQTPEGWLCHVTVYTHPALAKEDQSLSIDGESSRWETPGDLDVGYASLSLMGPGQYSDDAYSAELERVRQALAAANYEIIDED